MSTAYTVITETLDSVIANEIDRLEGSRDTAEDVMTDEETEQLNDFIDQLEEIRGVINSDELEDDIEAIKYDGRF